MYTATPGAALLELTLREVITNLPHDAGAVVVLVLLVSFGYLIWYGSRKSTVERFTSTSSATGEPTETAGREEGAVGVGRNR